MKWLNISPRFSNSLLLFLASLSSSATGPELEVYFIGNSITRGVSLDRLAWLFEEADGQFAYGAQAAGGAILHEHWFKERDSGATWRSNNLQSAPYGDYDVALSGNFFDAVVLQPYLYWLETQPGNEGTNLLGDRETIGLFMGYAMGQNPENNRATGNFYIYHSWPRLLGIHFRNPDSTLSNTEFGDSYTGYTFSDFYAEPYQTNVPLNQPRQTVPSRDYATQLILGLNADYPDLDQQVRLIPVGEVFARLDALIRAEDLPGVEAYFTRTSNAEYYLQARASDASFPIPGGVAFDAAYGVVNFYCDQIHMNAVPHNGLKDGTIGAYVAAITLYAVLTGMSPVGLPVTDGTGGWQRFDPASDAELVKALQEVVWEVVSTHPHTGADQRWAGYPVIGEREVDTGSFMGWLALMGNDWVWSYTLEKWLFMPEEQVSESGGWAYFTLSI